MIKLGNVLIFTEEETINNLFLNEQKILKIKNALNKNTADMHWFMLNLNYNKNEINSINNYFNINKIYEGSFEDIVLKPYLDIYTLILTNFIKRNEDDMLIFKNENPFKWNNTNIWIGNESMPLLFLQDKDYYYIIRTHLASASSIYLLTKENNNIDKILMEISL